MRLQKLKPEFLQTIAIATPLLVLLLAALLLVPKLMRLRSAHQVITTLRREAEARKRESSSEMGLRHTERLAAWPQSKDEQFTFLKELSRLVTASRVHLVSYQLEASGGENTAGEPPSANGLSIQPVAAEVAVSGSYSNLVTLFSSLTRANRLLAVENLQVRTDKPEQLSAAFRLIRYVIPVKITTAPRPTGSADGNGAGD